MDNRIRAITRLHEDFQPSSDFIQDQESETLLIDLPGFAKEQLRVQIDHYGALKISGERPIGNNRWRRFRKDFQVPPSCNANELRAKFENGVLNIIMPKKVAEPQASTQIPQPPPSPKYVPQPKPTYIPSQVLKPAPLPQSPPSEPRKTTPIPQAPQPPLSQKPAGEPKPAPIPQVPVSQKPEIAPILQAPPSQKLIMEPKPMPTPKRLIPTSPKPVIEGMLPGHKNEGHENKWGDGSVNIGAKGTDKIEEKQENHTKKAMDESDRKIKDGSIYNATQGGGRTADDYRKEIGGYVMELSKSNELVWNVVVAIFVVVALGIYIGYTIKSPWKT